MDNIAEGFEKDGNKVFKQFLAIAKGSCGETRSQMYRVADRNYVTPEKFEEIKEQLISLNKQIAGFMNYLQKTEFRRNKFK